MGSRRCLFLCGGFLFGWCVALSREEVVGVVALDWVFEKVLVSSQRRCNRVWFCMGIRFRNCLVKIW